MEEVLRKVLQRKRAFLRKYLVLTRSQVTHLRDLGLITHASYETLMMGEDSIHNVVVDHIMLTEHGQPERFLHFLKDEVGWVHEEVTSELKAETLELAIDDHVMEEAASVIHRHFGRSRRFSERDKKMMTSLVATRSQVAKEVWRRRLSEVTKALDKVKGNLKVREDSIRSISDVMETFLRQNQVEVFDFSRDMKSTSQILLETGYGQVGDVIGDFLSKVTSMLDRFRRVLFEKESLVRQKRLCMKVLERNDFESPLDRMMQDKMEELRVEQQMSEDMMEALKTRLATLDLEVRQRDKVIAKLRQEVVGLKLNLDDNDRWQHHKHAQNQQHMQQQDEQQQQEQLQKQQRMKKQIARLPAVRDMQTDKMASLSPPQAPVKLPRTPPAVKAVTTTQTLMKSKSAHGSSRQLLLNVK